MFANNEIKQYDGFYISYNPMCNLPLGDRWEGNIKPDETALVKEYKNGSKKFYILYGNYWDEMNKLAEDGYKEVKKFFDSKPAEQGFWSN